METQKDALDRWLDRHPCPLLLVGGAMAEVAAFVVLLVTGCTGDTAAAGVAALVMLATGICVGTIYGLAKLRWSLRAFRQQLLEDIRREIKCD